MIQFFCFFFKQKTAYEMRISDWSSDVCSSDLAAQDFQGRRQGLSPRPLVRAPDLERAQFYRPRLRHPPVACLAGVRHSPCRGRGRPGRVGRGRAMNDLATLIDAARVRSEEHTSETPVTNAHLVCRLLLEKKKKKNRTVRTVTSKK